MDGFKPEKQEPQIFSQPDDESIRPDASDRPERPERRNPRPRPQQSRPKFAVSRQQMMIGVAVVVLVLLIIAISSALKSPSEPEAQPQAQNGERPITLGTGNNDGATQLQPAEPVPSQTGQTGVNLPAINNLPTQAQQPSQTTGTGQRVDIPGDINDALNQGNTQAGINNAAQQNMNNLPPVVTPQEEPKKPVQQVKPQPVKTTTATPAKPRETTKPATAAPVPSKSGTAIAKAPAGNYTLQLSSASRADTLKAFAQKHGLSNYQVYETTRNGKSWYVLVYGNFPTVGDAKREVERLPAEIQGKKPWVRKMQQVHQDMK